jgi:hypothetical protein
MGDYDRGLHPVAKALLATFTVVLVCAGGGLLTFGTWTRNFPVAALGVACIFGAYITRPT